LSYIQTYTSPDKKETTVPQHEAIMSPSPAMIEPSKAKLDSKENNFPSKKSLLLHSLFGKKKKKVLSPTKSKEEAKGIDALFILYQENKASIFSVMAATFNKKTYTLENKDCGFKDSDSEEFKRILSPLCIILNIPRDSSYEKMRAAIFSKKLTPDDFSKLSHKKQRDIQVLYWFLISPDKEVCEHNRLLMIKHSEYYKQDSSSVTMKHNNV